MTTEPKFIPNEAVEISLGDNAHLKVRMIDCVGYIVDSSLGYVEVTSREWLQLRGLTTRLLLMRRRK